VESESIHGFVEAAMDWSAKQIDPLSVDGQPPRSCAASSQLREKCLASWGWRG